MGRGSEQASFPSKTLPENAVGDALLLPAAQVQKPYSLRTERLVSGHVFRCAERQRLENGFSRCKAAGAEARLH